MLHEGLPTKVHRDPFHQHLILREDRVATVAGFAVASTTPNLFDAVVRQAPVLEFAPDEKTERFPVEERTLLFIYCRDNQVAECIRCTARFHLREVASLDSFGIRTYVCGWCHTDLTNSIRAHLYGCAMLPVAIRRRMAQAPREAARSLVKQSHQLRDAADVAVWEAQATLHALRNAVRQSPLKRRE